MTDDTIPLPRSWAVKFLGQHAKVDSEMLKELRALVNPPKAPRRLRVVDLDSDESMIVGDDRLYVDVSNAADPMTLIEQQAKEWWLGSDTDIDALLRRIRAALEGATQ